MVIFLNLLVVTVTVLIMLFIVTQVFWPIYTGEPLFPIFGTTHSHNIVEAGWQLEDVAEAERLQAMQEEIDARRAKLKKEKE